MEGFFAHGLWAITDDEGDLLDVIRGSLDEATREAERGFDGEVFVDALGGEPDAGKGQLAANEGEVARLPLAPDRAMAAAQLPQLRLRDIESMPLEEAHARIRRFMPTERITKDGRRLPIYVWQKPNADMMGAVLSTNYKLSKVPISRGLNLLPHGNGFWSEPDRVAYLSGQLGAPPLPLSRTLCKYSNPFCRQTCLVYSGQNLVDDYAYNVKRGKTLALLAEPLAFARVLLSAIEWHEHNIREKRRQPYVRLNLLSDIAWELFMPGVMEAFPKTQFYDYTKVPGRFELPENYDLTFSYSGTNINHVESELRRGRRIATVFFNTSKKGQKASKLPAEWLGRQVVDGDRHDLRPKDDGAVIVGLRYKTPMAQLKEIRRGGPPPKFVVACFEEDRKVFVTAETPRQSNVGDYEDIAPAAE